MKKYIKFIIIAITVIFVFSFLVIANINRNKIEKNDGGKFKIVTSFYPTYIMTLNITQGADNIELINMADTNVGCIHDYTLNTEDMKKIENADVFVQNGLGLESFIDKITNSNNDLLIINSSKNITNLISEDEEKNPHIWTSISSYIQQVQNISEELIEKNPENAEIYRNNTKEYVKKLNELKLQYDTELQKLNGESAIILNESFEYLIRDAKMQGTMIHTDHEESTMSAETLKNIINQVIDENIKIIIIDINDDEKNAQTIAKETGAKIYKLDSCMTGSKSKDSYINSMKGNLATLKNVI